MKDFAKYVHARKELFWDIDPKFRKDLTPQAVLERILAYGSMEDVNELFQMFGLQKSKELFNLLLKKKRVNLRPPTINYFKLYFQKHAS